MKPLKDNLYPLLKLAMPLVLTGSMQSSVFFFQTLFLAHLGQDSLAAGALVVWVFGTVYVILFGILSSINVLIAHRHGANDKEGISLIVRDGLWLAILLTFPAFLLFWNLSPLLALTGQNSTILNLSTSYLHAMAWGLFPSFIVLAVLEVMIGLGRGRHILIFNLILVCLNTFFNFLFIFGKLGFPKLGIAGAGWGMSVSNLITAILISTTVFLMKDYRIYFRKVLTLTKPSYLLELLRIGIPMGAMYCVEVAFFLTVMLLMGRFGSQFLAANQITMQYAGLFVSVIFSTAQAITVRMGHLLGAGDVRSARQTCTIGVYISVGFMLIIAILYCVYPTSLLSIDINVDDPINASLVYHAKQFMMIAAVFQIFEAIRISFFGALRALKDTHFTLLISIVCFWGIALPIGYVLATRFYLEGTGLWWGMALSAMVGVVLLYYRFNAKIKNYLIDDVLKEKDDDHEIS